LACCRLSAPVEAQFGRVLGGIGPAPGSRFELSETVQLDRADNTVRATMDRVREYLDDQQWDEAVQALSEMMEQTGNKLLSVTEEDERRFISVRDYCQLQLSALPPEALALYRSRVDPSARKWCQEGIARRDRRLLEKVVDEAFASSWGDNALDALGEIALESADCAAARSYWEKIIPVEPPDGARHTWLCVPDTELDPAAVRARMVLASILEGSSSRARDELAVMTQSYADARGRLGGREVNYVEALSSLLEESEGWPKPEATADWPTFAGSPLRDKVAPAAIDPAGVAWRVPLRPTRAADLFIGGFGGGRVVPRLVAEEARSPLSYHPVVVGNLVLVNNQREILALDLDTGEPAWDAARPEIYRDPLDEEALALYDPSDGLGVPRFTMTAVGGKLYARMGSAVTSRPQQPQFARGAGYLVCLDLEAEGRMTWKAEPSERDLSFEGSPVADEANVYVAMRQGGIQPQAHVACFEAGSGRLRWRQFVCAAETPARGMLHETTHNLLTLHRDTIYLNTNLGAVAALSAHDGRVKWISLYPRALQGDLVRPAPHRGRDLNPCLYDRGILLVAPSDSRRIFALEAATGQILWQTDPRVDLDDVVHLLGVSDDSLIAAGGKLHWIGLKGEEAGKVKYSWPDGPETPGYGRGVLAGDCVLWPTRDTIHVFDRASGQQKKVISLEGRDATGGNLLVTERRLLIASGDELVALGVHARPPDQPPTKLARR